MSECFEGCVDVLGFITQINSWNIFCRCQSLSFAMCELFVHDLIFLSLLFLCARRCVCRSVFSYSLFYAESTLNRSVYLFLFDTRLKAL